jgi:hypothetical protein
MESYEVSEIIPTVLYSLKVYLKNNGSTAAAMNITAQVESSDTNITNISHISNQQFGNIDPGQIKSSTVATMTVQNSPNALNLDLHILSDGWNFWSDSLTAIITGLAKRERSIPLRYDLKQNYPNPFNPETYIQFLIPNSEFVTLKIYNVLGEEVATLVSRKLTAGKYQYEWDASSLASGVYLYRIQAGDYVESRKMILMR